MAGSVFDYIPDPDEVPNGAGFAALLRGMPPVSTDDPDRTGQVTLPKNGDITSTDGLMPWEKSQAPPSDDERGMVSEPAPVGKDDQPAYGGMATAATTSPDIYDPAQYGGATPPPQLKQYGDHSADYAAWQAQKASEDPSKFKASGWRRALAGIAGGMVAAGSRDPAAGWKVGEGVLNGPLDRAKTQWTAQEAPLQAKLTADTAQDAQTYRTNQGIEQAGRLQEQHTRNQYYGQLATEHAADFAAQAAARKNALVGFTPDDPSDRDSTGTGTTADGRTVKGAQPPAWYQDKWDKSPTNRANAQAQEGVATLRALEAAGVRLNDEQRAIVASGGKVTPSTRTTISIAENPDGSARLPGGRGASGPKNPDENVQAIVAKATQDKQKFADGWTRVDAAHAKPSIPEGSYVNSAKNKVIPAAEFAANIEKFRTDANVKLAKYGALIDDKGAVQREGTPAPSAPQAAQPAAAPALPAPVAAAPAAQGKQTYTIKGRQLTVGDPIVVDGKQVIFKGVNPQTKRIIYGQ